MADLHLLHPPEPDTNGGAAAASASAAALLMPGDPAAEAAAAVAEPPAPPYSKRRRRPSVRLGDIGAQATASDAQLPRRHRKPSSHPRPPRRSHPDDALDPNARGRSGGGPKPGQRRPRTAWIPAPHGGADGYEDEEGHHYYDDADQSDSAAARAARVSGSREASVDESDGVADWGLPNGGAACYGGGGVRAWLDGLGLSRYAPVFEIHEVDDEVLPLLTLEDLKDMGIGAVGSRRKMFAAIQKLRSSDTVS